jgi:hypothetical protein
VRRGVVLLTLFAIVGWAGCGRPHAPPGEWDERCVGRGPTKDRIRRNTADEAAAITVDTGIVRMGLRDGATAYAARHKGWAYASQSLVVERRGEVCTAERTRVWWRGKKCEVAHTKVEITPSECGAVLTCARTATPPEGEGMKSCDFQACADCDGWSVELSSNGRYRGCDWEAPPACVEEEMKRILWPGGGGCRRTP